MQQNDFGVRSERTHSLQRRSGCHREINRHEHAAVRFTRRLAYHQHRPLHHPEHALGRRAQHQVAHEILTARAQDEQIGIEFIDQANDLVHHRTGHHPHGSGHPMRLPQFVGQVTQRFAGIIDDALLDSRCAGAEQFMQSRHHSTVHGMHQRQLRIRFGSKLECTCKRLAGRRRQIGRRENVPDWLHVAPPFLRIKSDRCSAT